MMDVLLAQVATWPVGWANVITMVLFVILGAVVWLVPRDSVTGGLTAPRWWHDVRWWAVALIVVQLGIYRVFS